MVPLLEGVYVARCKQPNATLCIWDSWYDVVLVAQIKPLLHPCSLGFQLKKFIVTLCVYIILSLSVRNGEVFDQP